MVQNPCVSVIIPTYNRAEMLIRAIRSVLKQTFKDYELIIVDDGSTDDTAKILKDYKAHKFRYIRYNSNKGGAFARNLGIDNSKGKYIAFLDSDDEWLPAKLEKQTKFIENCPARVGAVYCLVLNKNDVIRKNSSKPKRGNVYGDLLRGWCPPTTSSFLIKAQALKRGVRFDGALPSFQDYDLWIRLSEYWEFDFVPEQLVIFHHHESDRISKDLMPRINGLDSFMDKWGHTIKKQLGSPGVTNFCRKYLSMIYSEAALDQLRRKKKKQALHFLKKLVQTRRMTLKFFIKFAILFFANKELYAIARSFHRILMKPHFIELDVEL
jgi:glycosyltransferase involved in cell wall biosynthesis